MRFAPVVLTREENQLRDEVREFLSQELPEGSYHPGLGMDAPHAPEFSRLLAQRGWVGMSIPPEYGGHGRTPVERFIVIEELLAAGAPVNAHWVADRQTAPAILRFGTEPQRRYFLPAIASGKCYFSIGMSEPDSGSDLASVRTTAIKVKGGWTITGTKIWTSGAHLNHYFVVLCRTHPMDGDRHQGLSQFIVDLKSPGIKINPINLLNNSHLFNEVVLEEVFVSDDMLLGESGRGWEQVTSELLYERSGPDRFLSTWPLFVAFLAEQRTFDARALEHIGRLAARYWTIRQLSLSLARAMQEGRAPAVEAAMLKDLGTSFEQETASVLQYLVEDDPNPESSSRFECLFALAILTSPSFTIRGGTTEILRSVIAQGLRTE